MAADFGFARRACQAVIVSVRWSAVRAGQSFCQQRDGALAAVRFFLGTLFIPQLSSPERQPHPLMVGFRRAAAQN